MSRKRPSRRVPGAVRILTGSLSRVAPPLAVALAERMFLRPLPRPIRTVESRWLERAETIRLDTPSGLLHGHRWGNGGPSILLAHGWGGRGAQLGGIGVRLADLGFSAVAWDMPGHGDATRQTSLPEMSAAMAAIAEQVHDVVGVVSHSFGTATTLGAVSLHGVEVPRLAAVAPAAILHRIGLQFSDVWGFTRPVVERMRHRLASRIGFEWEELEAATVAPTIDAPALVLHDRQDEWVPYEDGVAFAGMLPNVTTVSTSGLGHTGPLRDDAAIDTVTGFFGPTEI